VKTFVLIAICLIPLATIPAFAEELPDSCRGVVDLFSPGGKKCESDIQWEVRKWCLKQNNQHDASAVQCAAEFNKKIFEKCIVTNGDAGCLMDNLKKSYTELSFQEKSSESSGGGCLIATATYGTELAPQVQMLREIRDNSLLQTQSGQTFMESFNEFYYSFSPVVADYERENPVFREAVKIVITPLIASLSILNYVDMDSESDVLTYGISLIMLNVGMYFVAPAIIIHKLKNSKN